MNTPTITVASTAAPVASANPAVDPIYESIKRAWCPEHADIVKADLLALVASAQHTIDIGIYGFAWQPLVDALIERHKAGVKVRIVFDRTQSAGLGERDKVAQIAAAGIEFYIGTSPHHQIRHTKNIVVDGVAGEMGSLNYSLTGFLQNNTVEFFYNVYLAQRIIADLEFNIAWLVENEKEWNIPAGHPILTAPMPKSLKPPAQPSQGATT